MNNDIKTPSTVLFREALKIRKVAFDALVVRIDACRMGFF